MEHPTVEKQPSGIPRLSRLPVPSARPTSHQNPLLRSQLQDKVVNLSIPRRRPEVQKKESFTYSRPSVRPAAERRDLNVSDKPRQSSGLKETSIEPRQEIADETMAIPQQGPQPLTEPISQNLDAPKDPETEISTRTIERKSRPSLSERTIQTISQIPPSPSPGRRRSSFYQPQSPMVLSHTIVTPSRPRSRLQEQMAYDTEQRQDRPSRTHLVNHLHSRNVPISSPVVNRQVTSAPTSRLVDTSLARSKPTMVAKPQTQSASSSRSKNPVREDSAVPNSAKGPQQGSKTLVTKSIRPRPSLRDSQLEPSQNMTGERITTQPRVPARRTISAKGVSNSRERPTFKDTESQTRPFQTQADMSASSDASTIDAFKASKSSAALRQTIAKAKAARKLTAQTQPSIEAGKSLVTSVEESTDNYADLASKGPDQIFISTMGGSSLSARVEAARTSGRLNISAMGLRDIPRQVLNMYKLDTIDSSKGAWYESVDLIQFIAADNELAHIASEVFPDVDPKDTSDELDEIENVFGALEFLDLHGNILRELPVGLRRLERLTNLNLSNNNLGKECLDIISQCLSLKILRLANNELVGDLDDHLTYLASLEVLDISHNSITSLPESLARMIHLRSLNMSGNGLTSLPFRAIAELPVTELIASKNRIGGSLFPPDVRGMDSLQILDVSDNGLTSLTELSKLEFQSLRQLHLAGNRLTSLPDISEWTALVTLDASDNRISSIPDGFISLNKIKQANFTGNNIKKLDDRIGMMESLEIFKISNNPLKPLKYLTMSTEDLKHDLKLRLDPAVEESGEVLLPEGEEMVKPVAQPHVVGEELEIWPVTSRGLLDGSSRGLRSLDTAILESTSTRYTITSADFHHNLLTSIPVSLSALAMTLTKLSLANNKIEGSYLTSRLELPSLLDLNFSCNSITTLDPLLEHLSAPSLSSLNVSANRISTLPILREAYPSLSTLIANDNRISELDVNSVEGLTVIDLRNNDIAHLPPRLGLLRGIQRLDLGGNVFRVPRLGTLEKGTQATLAWLRDRIPAEEGVEYDIEE